MLASSHSPIASSTMTSVIDMGRDRKSPPRFGASSTSSQPLNAAAPSSASASTTCVTDQAVGRRFNDALCNVKVADTPIPLARKQVGTPTAAAGAWPMGPRHPKRQPLWRGYEQHSHNSSYGMLVFTRALRELQHRHKKRLRGTG